MLFKYTLVISPSAQIIALVRALKERLGITIGAHFGSKNSLAHMTLFVFFATEENYPKILAEFKRLLAVLEPFELVFSGFDQFSENGTFYVKPTGESSESIKSLCKYIQSNFNQSLKKQSLERWKGSFHTPHLSVARELSIDSLQIASKLFTEFEQSYLCDSFVIRRFNESRGQYDIIDTIPLLGQDYPKKQLSIFSN